MKSVERVVTPRTYFLLSTTAQNHRTQALGGRIDGRPHGRAPGTRRGAERRESGRQDPWTTRCHRERIQHCQQLRAADIEEIRRAVKSFEEEGKPATVVQESIPSLQALYFSTAFSRSILHPRGTVSLTGLTNTAFFAGPLLQKHGVRVDVFRHGRYKSAPSFFASTGSTQAERENTASVQNCTRSTLCRGQHGRRSKRH